MGTREGNSISAYLFVLTLEGIFALINANPNIEPPQLFNHNFSYSVYADDTTFFLRNKNSALKLINTFDTFSLFSGLTIKKENVKWLVSVSKRGCRWHTVE